MAQSKISIPDSKQLAIQGVFQSINTNGLIPLSNIPNSVLTNPVTQCQSLDGDICVNYVNLRQANPTESRLALSLAVEEEYCGIYGICLERQWPFQRFSSNELCRAEISARLLSSAVFILNPPQKKIGICTVNGGNRPSEIASYEVNKDGFAQQRDRSVTTGLKMSYSNRVTEIKTPHKFRKNEIKAVLVPEHLLNMANEFFENLRIIPVASKVITLHAIPKILEYYHNEVLKNPVRVEAPDYLGAIHTFCDNEQIKTFSLHAVRLHTNFDFIIRPISKVSDNEPLLLSTHAKIATKYDDDSAFIIVHKNYGQSKLNLIQRLRTNDFLPEKYILKMEQGCQFSIDMNNKLTQLKGELILSNVYRELSDSQLSLLVDPAIKIMKTERFYVLAYPAVLECYVNKVVNKFNLMQDAATKIQAYTRGARTRTFFEDYRQKQENLEIAKREFEVADEKLRNLSM